ncbi:MAG: HIT domain-containing protein [Candidatus Saganbacteria bacterium]|nr:HIT domain-containing protein [Candidatus Saganbacteria bacterium]
MPVFNKIARRGLGHLRSIPVGAARAFQTRSGFDRPSALKRHTANILQVADLVLVPLFPQGVKIESVRAGLLGCLHCDSRSESYRRVLEETKHFRVVADRHPVGRGHIAVISKSHVPCLGSRQLPKEALVEFKQLYEKIERFLVKEYGTAAIYEHGITGQTVSHAHVHFLPFAGSIDQIVDPSTIIGEINTVQDLKKVMSDRGRYLFIKLNHRLYLVNPKVGRPGFFRDNFSYAKGNPERASWRKMRQDMVLMNTVVEREIRTLERKWIVYNK